MRGWSDDLESRMESISEWGADGSSEDPVNSIRNLGVHPRDNSQPSVSFRYSKQ